MTFKRPANDRQLTFKDISAETKLPVNEVCKNEKQNFFKKRWVSYGVLWFKAFGDK